MNGRDLFNPLGYSAQQVWWTTKDNSKLVRKTPFFDSYWTFHYKELYFASRWNAFKFVRHEHVRTKLHDLTSASDLRWWILVNYKLDLVSVCLGYYFQYPLVIILSSMCHIPVVLRLSPLKLNCQMLTIHFNF